MDELLIALVLLIVKLIVWIFKTIFKTLARMGRLVARLQAGKGAEAQQATIEPARLSRSDATPAAAVENVERAVLQQLRSRLDGLERTARAEAERASAEDANQVIGDSIERDLLPLLREARRRADREGLRAASSGLDAAAFVEAALELLGAMAAQRRDPELLLLLGDSDALGDACYRPILDYARAHGIGLRQERVVTLLGDEDLAAITGPMPGGLAPIVLPRRWATDVTWWPALAHEVGHAFHRSVEGLDGDLRRTLGLPPPEEAFAEGPLSMRDLHIAVGIWLPELFADAFGLMMLGPAALRTAIDVLGSPDRPQRVQIAAPLKGRWIDEHPPAHLRVVVGCRLLDQMGYAKEAAQLEAAWRHRHGDPDEIYLPTPRNTWATVPEAIVVDAALRVALCLYEEPLPSLAQQELRCIPGLDFGPREHQAALDASQALLAGRRPTTRDPRALLAGAVLARVEQPREGARLLAAARAYIPSVGVPRRRLRLRAEAADAALQQEEGIVPTADMVVDALVLRAILERPGPPSARLR